MAISAAVSAKLYTSDFGLAPSIGCGIIAAVACGLFNGALISRFKIQPIIVTLVVMIAGRGLAMRIQGQLSVSLEYTPFGEFGLYKIAGKVPVQIAIMAAAVAIMLFLAKKTVFAKRVEAVGDNPRAARLVGINIFATTTGVYVVCAVLCAVAGNMEAARLAGVNVARLGLLVELDAIAAVAIGGTPFSGGRARIMGTVVGASVVALVPVIVNMNNIPSHYSLVLKALIVIVAMWLQRKQ
jgi:ribose/xylose/arabinose/galactoside ABC-type transport system permease subunit